MFRRHAEIWSTLIAVVVVTALYAVAYLQAGAFPIASGLIGHGIGIAGFVLMLMTEVLYTIRKRLADARWGSMASWLQFHIVTGLVGPYMVLLHTAMRFQGLAGVLTLLTVVVVASGLVGRYLYTAVPIADEQGTGGAAHATTRRRVLAAWRAVHLPLTWTLFALAFVHVVAALYYATLQR